MTSPVFLFTGPEAGQRNEEVENQKKSLKKKFGEVEEYLFYASETPAVEYLAILQNESLFSDCTCVVVKNADSIKKDEVEGILDWLKNASSESNVLILVADSISVDAKLEKAIPASNKKIFWELKEEYKPTWVREFFSKNGYKITSDGISVILQMVENNTQVLKVECSRFFSLFSKDHQITEDDVEQVLVHNREENVFTLFDTMAAYYPDNQTRFQKSLEVLQEVLLSKNGTSFKIIVGLSSCFRKVILWNKLHAAGKSDDFNLKINGFSSKKQKSQYTNASRVWTSGQATAILAILSQTDMDIRSGGSLMHDTYLVRLIYEITIKKGATSASYEI